MSSAATFEVQLTAAAKKTVDQAVEGIRSAALQLYSDLVTEAKAQGQGAFGSPVASGRYAASFRLGINTIDTSTAPPDLNYRYPPGGGPRPLPPRTIPNVPIADIAAKLRTFKLGDTIYISNSVPYVRRIEVGRHSWQTPDGVFERTILRWQNGMSGWFTHLDVNLGGSRLVRV